MSRKPAGDHAGSAVFLAAVHRPADFQKMLEEQVAQT
jgi:hypothetical protein